MNYAKGITLAVKREGIYNHFGIATGDGNVIHNSKGKGVIKSPESEFSNGGEIWLCEITSEDLQCAYENAKALIGKSYDLISYNCEHFVNDVHGKGKNSVQIQRAFINGGGIAYLTNKNVSPELKALVGVAMIGSLIDSEDPVGGAVKGALIGGGVILLYRFLSR